MSDVRGPKRKLTQIFIALGVVDLLAIVALLSPLVGSAGSRRAEMTRLQAELDAKTKEVEPLRGLDQKIVTAKQQIADFYRDRFPAQTSAIQEALGKVTAAHSVHIDQVKYDPKGAPTERLQMVEIDGGFSGNYVNLMQFINGLERDKIFFLVESVNLSDAQGGQVRLQMKLQTYVKAGA
jgi:type IV pilus assembly protein PilO